MSTTVQIGNVGARIKAYRKTTSERVHKTELTHTCHQTILLHSFNYNISISMSTTENRSEQRAHDICSLLSGRADDHMCNKGYARVHNNAIYAN